MHRPSDQLANQKIVRKDNTTYRQIDKPTTTWASTKTNILTDGFCFPFREICVSYEHILDLCDDISLPLPMID